MKVFLSIKYYDDMKNKNLIENICNLLENNGVKVFVFARDIQNYKKCKLSPQEIMKIAFDEIKSSDIILVDASELSIGVGIEVGFAYSKNIPIYLIANNKAYVSNSIKGVSQKSVFYNDISEILSLF